MRIRLLVMAALLLAIGQGWAAPAVINAGVETLDFGDVELGYPVSKSFMVTGSDLSGDINLALEGRHTSYYVVTPTTITPEEAAGGVLVTVKCSPPSPYILGANIKLTSLDAEDVVIPITVNVYTPELFLKNQTEYFTAPVYGFSKRTGSVQFADAEIPPYPDPNTPVVRSVGTAYVVPDCYSLSIEGADAIHFTARIVRGSFIANICTVEITYAPRECGTHTATLNLNCTKAGVPWMSIPLQGEATEVLGDLDGDGVLGIGDVTGFINLMLTNGEIPSTADLDCDGSVNISDVTLLINRLLNAAK